MPPLLSAPKITEPKWWAVIVSATVPATSLSGSPTRNSWPIRCASVIEASTVAGQEAVGDGEGDAFGAAAVAEWVTDTDADEDAGCDGSPDPPPHPAAATTAGARTGGGPASPLISIPRRSKGSRRGYTPPPPPNGEGEVSAG